MTLKAVLKLQAEEFKRGLSTVQTKLNQFGNFVKGAFATAAVAAFGKKVVQVGAEFEDAMARVQAVSNATPEGFERMERAARKMGETTKYTAIEAANALEILTRNGLKATEAAQALPQVLRLAQANAISLSDAGDILTNTINMFGLSIDDAEKVSDILSTTAAHTATNIKQLYSALVNAAPAASQLGFTLEETSAALGALAQKGVKAEEAGTQLRMALVKMADPNIIAKMNQYGLGINEVTMSAEGLQGTIERLRDAHLSFENLVDIFSQKGAIGMARLISAYDEFVEVLDYTKNAQGTTSRMFIQGLGDVQGEIKRLKSVWESFKISISENTKGIVKNVLNLLQNLISNFNSIGGFITNIVSIVGVFVLTHVNKVYAKMKLLADNNTRHYEAAIAKKKLAEDAYLKSMMKTQALGLDHEIAIENEKTAKTKEATTQRLKIEKEYQKAKLATAKAYAHLEETAIAESNAKIEAELSKPKAAKALKSLWLTAIAEVAFALGSVLIGALNKVHKVIKDANKEADKLNGQFKVTEIKAQKLIDTIGDESDEDSINGVINKLKEMLPDVADMFGSWKSALDNAGDAAENSVGKYDKLKESLERIVELQGKITANNALQTQINANAESLKSSLTNKTSLGRKLIQGNMGEYYNLNLKKIGNALDNGRLFGDRGKRENAFTDIINLMTANISNGTLQEESTFKQVKDYLDSAVLNADFSDDTIRGAIDEIKATDQWKSIVAAVDRLQATQEEIDSTKQSVKLEKLMDDAKALGIKYNGTNKSINKQIKELEGLIRKRQSGGVDIEEDKNSKGKTLKSVVSDALKEQEELNNQYEQGSITQEKYKKELRKLTEDTYAAMGAFKDFREELKGKNYTQAERDFATNVDNAVELYKTQDELDEKAKKTLEQYDKQLDKLVDIENEVDAINNKINDGTTTSEQIKNNTNKKKELVDIAIDLKKLDLTNFFEDSTMQEQAREIYNKLITQIQSLIEENKDLEVKLKAEVELENAKKIWDESQGLLGNLVDNTGDEFKSVASSVNRLMSSLENIKDVLGIDESVFEGWEKFVGVFNALIQTIQTVLTIISLVKSIQEVFDAKKVVADAATTIASNAAVAASEVALTEAYIDAAIAGAAASQASIPIAGPVMAVTASETVGAGVLANILKYKDGGIVPGNSTTGDKVLAGLNSGEMVLNKGQQATLFSMLNGKGNGTGGDVKFHISGKDLEGVLKNYNTIKKG